MAELNFLIISVNTAGLVNLRIVVKKPIHHLKQQTSNSGIIFMQETRTVRSDERVWTSQLGCGSHSVIFSHEKSDA